MDDILKRCQAFKKAELHVHLNGLFDSELIKETIIEEQTQLPNGFDIEKDLNVLHHKNSLIEYLKPWDVLRLIPKKEENFSKLIHKAFESLYKDNVNIVELRSSIIYLSLLQKKTIEETLIMVLSELSNASLKYKIKFCLLLSIPRSDYSMVHLKNLVEAFENIGKPKEIVGLDLTGNEDYRISKDISKTFRSMKDKYGFQLTIHAGETGNLGNIIEAINEFNTNRIGHGTAAIKCQKTMNLLAKKNICVEVCPISNRRTGAVKPNEAHPVKSFIQNNVPFVLCSDNPGIHKALLTSDYYEFYKETRDLEILDNMYKIQKKFSFIR